MARISITFDTDNAAFRENFAGEVQQALDQAAHWLCNRQYYIDNALSGTHALRDSNGNKIGTIEY